MGSRLATCRRWFALAAALLAVGAGRAAELSATELRWLHGAAPVLAHARAAGLPLDVIVQPQPTPGLPPLALAFIDSRCKLVLSMRGNPQVQATLDRIEPELLDPTLELMAAHELGHCRRYLDGAWNDLPAAFSSGMPAALDAPQPAARAAGMTPQAARREEAYGDLAGLAWTQRRYPQHFARLHAWLVAERTRGFVAGSTHDTLAWLRLATQGGELAGGSMFEAAHAMWASGLAVAD